MGAANPPDLNFANVPLFSIAGLIRSWIQETQGGIDMRRIAKAFLAGLLAVTFLPLAAQEPATPDYASMTNEQLGNAVNSLLDAGEFVAAIPGVEEVINRYERDGILTREDGIGWVGDLRKGYRAVQRDEPLIALTRRVISACKRELGTRNECWVDWHQILAQDLRIAKQMEAAYPAYRNWLDMVVEAHSGESEKAQEARREFTFYLEEIGQEDEAIALWKESYAVSKVLRGPYDINTTELAERIRAAYIRNDRLKDAELLSRELASELEAGLGPQDRQTRNWQVLIASTLKLQDDLKGASAILRSVLDTAPGDGSGVAATYNAKSMLEEIAELTGDFASVEAIYLANLKEARTLLDEDPLATEEALGFLSEAYVKRNELTKAEPLTLELLALYEAQDQNELWGLFIALTQQQLTEIYARQGRFDEAQAMAKAAFSEFSEDGGVFRADAIIALSSSFSLAGEYGQAETILLDAVAKKFEPKLVSALARLYLDQDRLAEAETLLARSTEGDTSRVNGEVADVALLGELYLKQGRTEDARFQFLYQLAIARQWAGTNPAPIIDALYSLSLAEQDQLRFDLAGERIDEALRLYGPNASPTNPDTLKLYFQRARITVSQGQYARGVLEMSDALNAAQASFGSGHQLTLEIAEQACCDCVSDEFS
ncbi:hypothetical protein EH31_15925 [Erythrobacter longus]|uniref:Tetratricopeptide repeat protein n=2 Tax=Erythrobacter longus TaxID=1044 RepID=A0A074M828_ERYLO|nr:hypothetical protein EH31_15925 [Erythrobacter longus]